MNKTHLSGFWLRWRQWQFRQLRDEGVSIPAARRLAEAEARARRRLSGIIGRDAAEALPLVAIEDGDRPRVGLMGTFAGLDADQRERLAAVANLYPALVP